MGNFEIPYRDGEARRMTFPEGAFVVAEEAHLAGLENLRQNVPIRLVPLDLAEPIPDEVVGKASIVVLHADPVNPASMHRIATLRASRPLMPLIVALTKADLSTARSLIHQGVSDVVSIPFEEDQITDALIDASIGAENEPSYGKPLGELYSVIGGAGGCGVTTIATHLAAELASQNGKSCCLLDLDLQFGTAASYLGVSEERSVRDLLDAKSRLDSDLFKSVAIDVGDSVKFVPAPSEILPIEEVDVDQILRVIDCARQNADMVMLDLPLDFTNWSVSAMLGSTKILVVVELNLTSLRNARRRIDLLVDMGVDRNIIHAVTNRVEKKFFKAIDNSDAQKALKVPIVGSVTYDNSVLLTAQDQGLLTHMYQYKNNFSKQIADLACAFATVGGGE